MTQEQIRQAIEKVLAEHARIERKIIQERTQHVQHILVKLPSK